MADQQTIEAQQALLANHRRTLAHLLQQAAQYGGQPFSPPTVASGIEEARQEIVRIKSLLREQGLQVEDEPIERLYDPRPDSYSQGIMALAEVYRNISNNVKDEIVSALKADIASMRDNESKLIEFLQNLDNETKILREEVRRLRLIMQPTSSMDGEEEIKDEIKHQSALKKEINRRLHALEMEQARKGIDTPPQVETQINDLRERISEIDAKIKILTYNLQQALSPDHNQ
jgi:hypothetical protein